MLGWLITLTLAVLLFAGAVFLARAVFGQMPPTVTPNLTPIPTFTPKPTKVYPPQPPPPPTPTYLAAEEERSRNIWDLGAGRYLYVNTIDGEFFVMRICEGVPDPATGEMTNPPFLLCETPAVAVDKHAWRWLRYRAGKELGPQWR